MDTSYSAEEPLAEAQGIKSAIRQEAEPRQIFSAFRLEQGGVSRCLETDRAVELLDAALLLHRCLQERDGGADAFARKICGSYDISPERFDALIQERLENTGRVAGVFELDFDKKVFSAVSIMDGWKSFWFQDVSAAACHAFRKEDCGQEARWQRFLDRLAGKELTGWELCTSLKALRELQPGDLLFTEPAERRDRLLDFPVNCASDTVQMEVFGPRVQCSKPGSWFTIRVGYDVSRQEVRDHLELALYRKDGALEETSRYDLTPAEQELLQSEMEAYCQKQYGKALNGLYAERYCQENGLPPVLDSGNQRLDMSAISFEGVLSECCGKLNFYVPVTFDPDAVFGTHVASESNDNWLNVYANFDLETGEPDRALTVVLICGDGNELGFSYSLNTAEQEQLREKMEGYCQAQTGMSLENYRQELLSEGPFTEQEPQM